MGIWLSPAMDVERRNQRESTMVHDKFSINGKGKNLVTCNKQELGTGSGAWYRKCGTKPDNKHDFLSIPSKFPKLLFFGLEL